MAIIWTRFVGGVLASIVIASQVVHAIRGMADTISGVTYEEAQSSLSRTGSCVSYNICIGKMGPMTSKT